MLHAASRQSQLLDATCPVNWEHDLNRGLIGWWGGWPLSGWKRGKSLRDAVGLSSRKGSKDITLSAPTKWTSGPNGFDGGIFASSAFAQSASTINLTGVTKLVLAYWLWWDAFATNDSLCMESSANFNLNAGGYTCNMNNSSAPQRPVFGPSAGNNFSYNTVTIPARPSAAAWHHYVIVLDLAKWSTTDPANCAVVALYIDGSPQTLSADALSGTAPADFGNFTWNFMCRNGAGQFGAGRLTDFRMSTGRIFGAADAADLYLESCEGYPKLLRWIRAQDYVGATSPPPPPPATSSNLLLLGVG